MMSRSKPNPKGGRKRPPAVGTAAYDSKRMYIDSMYKCLDDLRNLYRAIQVIEFSHAKHDYLNPSAWGPVKKEINRIGNELSGAIKNE